MSFCAHYNLYLSTQFWEENNKKLPWFVVFGFFNFGTLFNTALSSALRFHYVGDAGIEPIAVATLALAACNSWAKSIQGEQRHEKIQYGTT